MKCVIVLVICFISFLAASQGMTIHLLDIAPQQSSIEDGSLLMRSFFLKNNPERLPIYTPELDLTAQIKSIDLSKAFDTDEVETPDPNSGESDIDEVFDSWSIVWYIASFSGLILFFLIVSCSEWCCRNRIRRQQQQQNTQTTQSTTSQTDGRVIATRSQPEQQPPPPYDQFAPPSYDSLLNAVVGNSSDTKKSEYEVYVVPVHTMTTMMSGGGGTEASSAAVGTEEAPPSYAVLNIQENRC